jgi:hypothetical protein
MFVEPIVTTRKTFKLTFTAEEKAQRRSMIDTLTAQVINRYSEYGDTSTISKKAVKAQVTKRYDAIIRRKVLATL